MKILGTFLLALFSFSAFAMTSFDGRYELDEVFSSTEDCPQEIVISSFPGSEFLNIFIPEGMNERREEHGKFIRIDFKEKGNHLDRVVSDFSQNIYGDLIQEITYEKNEVVLTNTFRKKGSGVIWQLKDLKKKRNNMTCLYL